MKEQTKAVAQVLHNFLDTKPGIDIRNVKPPKLVYNTILPRSEKKLFGTSYL